MRKRYSAEFKAKVALDAIQEQKTLTELSSKYEISTSQVVKWKKELLQRATEIFAKESKGTVETEKKESELYRQIGQLKVELDWLKKKSEQAGVRFTGIR